MRSQLFKKSARGYPPLTSSRSNWSKPFNLCILLRYQTGRECITFPPNMYWSRLKTQTAVLPFDFRTTSAIQTARARRKDHRRIWSAKTSRGTLALAGMGNHKNCVDNPVCVHLSIQSLSSPGTRVIHAYSFPTNA